VHQQRVELTQSLLLVFRIAANGFGHGVLDGQVVVQKLAVA